MNRRQSLKTLGLSALSVGTLLEACQPVDNKAKSGEATAAGADSTVAGAEDHLAAAGVPGREAWEVERDKKLEKGKFFTEAEMATITVLVDIIIPKDDHSGSASQAGVPAYIEFTAKDQPDNQVPLRGGLRWLDVQCLDQYGQPFVHCSTAQQIALIDQIAYPEKADPAMQQGVAFFNRMRNLTASGFYTTEMGVNDLGYAGNHPGKWDGVPEAVLKQYGLENVKV
jgi:hypothetical protein